MVRITKSLKGRGTTAAIMSLLVISAGLRVISSADSVLAANSQDPQVASEPTENMRKNENQLPSEAGLERLLVALQQREEAVTEKEQLVAERSAQLQELEIKMKTQLEEMRVAEKELKATIALANSAAEDDLARLTEVYENMKPKIAAGLFQEMAPDFAAGFLGRMRPDTAAAVMAGMTPEAAYAVSAILAGRNANVPTE